MFTKKVNGRKNRDSQNDKLRYHLMRVILTINYVRNKQS